MIYNDRSGMIDGRAFSVWDKEGYDAGGTLRTCFALIRWDGTIQVWEVDTSCPSVVR